VAGGNKCALFSSPPRLLYWSLPLLPLGFSLFFFCASESRCKAEEVEGGAASTCECVKFARTCCSPRLLSSSVSVCFPPLFLCVCVGCFPPLFLCVSVYVGLGARQARILSEGARHGCNDALRAVRAVRALRVVRALRRLHS